MNIKAFLIALLILAVAAAAGYYFWQKQKNKKTESNQNQPALESGAATSSTETENSNATSETVNTSGSEAILMPNGLKIEILKQGTGDVIKKGDQVLVNYIGTLTDGTKFDSSYDRKVPLQVVVGVGQVIQGWDQGLLGMKVGEKRKLTIPPELAYGAGGVAGAIPPNAILIFEVELMQIIR
jgi:FKBP-type peptidyl-prolyl cis-trans isomerase